MSEQGPSDQVGPDTAAEILQSTFQHYSAMAMDHHGKAATTSNILLIVVGAIVTLLGTDGRVGGAVDFVGGLSVFVFGVFGGAWAWKQHERYHYWDFVAYQYQLELTRRVPGLVPWEGHHLAAREHSRRMFGRLFAERIRDRYLWIALHALVALAGLGLMAAAGL